MEKDARRNISQEQQANSDLPSNCNLYVQMVNHYNHTNVAKQNDLNNQKKLGCEVESHISENVQPEEHNYNGDVDSDAEVIIDSTTELPSVRDIDAGDKNNMLLVSEYANDIYDYLFQLEQQQLVHPDYMAGQVDINSKMRTILLDWLSEVHCQFRLLGEVFQMAVGMIDRYLQAAANVKRCELQLVGVTALFLAAKYEEIYPPPISDFVYICDDTYTGQDIRQMEMKIFKALNYSLSRPIPLRFLRRFSKAANAHNEQHVMAKYFIELSLIDYDLCSYKPSEV